MSGAVIFYVFAWYVVGYVLQLGFSALFERKLTVDDFIWSGALVAWLGPLLVVPALFYAGVTGQMGWLKKTVVDFSPKTKDEDQ